MTRKSLFLMSLLAAVVVILFVSCSKDDNTPTGPVTSQSELGALKVSTAPTLDGTIDEGWSKADVLATTLVVPLPGSTYTPLTSGNYFMSYVGASYNFKLRSMYDADNIYFLAEWDDPKKDLNRDPWYFNPTTKLWAQESRFPTYDLNRVFQRGAFYEDKFAMLWNINESMPEFNTSGCYASCHTGLDIATHFNAPALHYTNSATQFIDMWHWKAVRTGLYQDGTGTGVLKGQVDDQYQDNAEFGQSGGTAEGGRKSDSKTSGGYSDNKQTLTITGTSTSVTVPKYVIPGKTYYYAILQSEIAGGTAKLVTAVDANGVLTYNGGTIDPNTDVQYQRAGTGTGSKVIPSVTISPIVGDRGDIEMAAVHTGSGWIMEFKRKLNTGSTRDVQFDPTKSYVFGVGIFDNSALAHAIHAKATLKFK